MINKNKLVILLIALLSFQYSKSQNNINDFDLSASPGINQKNSNITDIVYSTENYFILMKTSVVKRKNVLTLEKIGQNFEVLKSIDITSFLDSDGNTRVYKDVLTFNDKIYLFTNKYIKKKSSTDYFQIIDPNSLDIEDNVKVLNETDLTIKVKYGKPRLVIGSIGRSNLMAEVNEMEQNKLIFSPNGKNILLYSKSINDREGPDYISVKIQNENLESIWENDSISLPYNSLLFDIERIKINNNQEIFLTGIEYNEKRKTKVKGHSNYKYHLIKISNKGKTIEDLEIKVEDKFISACDFTFDNESNIIVTGFYSETNAYNILGAFSTRVNYASNKIEASNYGQFKFQISTDVSNNNQEKNKEKDNKNKELPNFYFKDLILNKNNSFTLIAEEYKVKVKYVSVPGAGGQTQEVPDYYYTYGDIIIVNISKEGKINWSSKINKLQFTNNDEGKFSSYVFTTISNDLYIIYNDHPDNLNIPNTKDHYSFSIKDATNQVIVKINEAGEQSKKEVLYPHSGSFAILPEISLKDKSGNLILFGNNGKDSQFIRLKLK